MSSGRLTPPEFDERIPKRRKNDFSASPAQNEWHLQNEKNPVTSSGRLDPRVLNELAPKLRKNTPAASSYGGVQAEQENTLTLATQLSSPGRASALSQVSKSRPLHGTTETHMTGFLTPDTPKAPPSSDNSVQRASPSRLTPFREMVQQAYELVRTGSRSNFAQYQKMVVQLQEATRTVQAVADRMIEEKWAKISKMSEKERIEWILKSQLEREME
jgi:hypothetical protein